MTSQKIPLDFIKSMLSANGFEEMSDEMINLISEEAENSISELFNEATKFMRHSKRKILTIQDINSALKLKKLEPYYGYNPSIPLYYQRLPSNHEMFVRQEQSIGLNEAVHCQFFPDIPRDINVGCHWLTVEGVQPLIPQNPSVVVQEKQKQEETIETKPIIQHSLSKELQMYYDMVVEILNTNNKEKIDECLDSVRTDSGLQQLTPYFIRYISNHTLANLGSLEILANMLSLVNAMRENQNINLEPYLHQLFPVILTLVVTKQIGTNSYDNHWNIRVQAAAIVKKLRDRYSEKYGRLHARLLQTYLQAITDATKPLTTQYGGIVGITAMGPRAVYHLLVPAMKSLKERYLGSSNECKMCLQALFDAAFMLAEKMKEMMMDSKQNVCDELRDKKKELVADEFNIDETFKTLHEIFGDVIVPTSLVDPDIKNITL
ncbi:TFIID transcription factor subunit, putative [Entamoeba histolytica HM-1:IMSS-B]|uniref:TFIID subunit, putative n=8 Tax=Entamoeba TaxID=5758 RepID=C4M9D5_ENTH1|nr:TFIID subunit, putative [Entamoeba nuttalli P19]XP_650399.1 TFIID subunit, putative [Entamoeba histolytica HM-1:IMSS]EMD42805.1 transcription initiation factor tfiid, putative [Entamoeba histolytica KU27]EMH72553.1 TFIID transcription factor subunit, putative [Entamoeba histolytica HM-1:IMSS-B]EMS15187.1 transcription initiation factor tfiid, putative [Entamoeba histolytica HM-3:IMSS]ENY62563.1 transcription initiation factor tfiid, putative [Entamoeba histolytica HM-1:IMSS-A]GAT98272.1 tf|eukprot:XP_008855107.1 TFIID subunit, putative [Entamoeba nuttalli P19]